VHPRIFYFSKGVELSYPVSLHSPPFLDFLSLSFFLPFIEESIEGTPPRPPGNVGPLVSYAFTRRLNCLTHRYTCGHFFLSGLFWFFFPLGRTASHPCDLSPTPPPLIVSLFEHRVKARPSTPAFLLSESLKPPFLLTCALDPRTCFSTPLKPHFRSSIASRSPVRFLSLIFGGPLFYDPRLFSRFRSTTFLVSPLPPVDTLT